jgi:TonB family protein
MFDMLSQAPERGPLGGGLASFVLHAGLITGAMLATLQTRTPKLPVHVVVPLVYVDRTPASPSPAPHAAIGGSPPAVGVEPHLVIPAMAPRVTPPPSTAPFDPAGFGLLPPAAVEVPAPRPDPGGNGVYGERWVEQRPELVSHPAVAFPEVLRRAGIGGRVVLEAVVDTSGRVDPHSIVVRTATHPLFAEPARAMVAGSRYRPGRVGGRAVRVRVLVPVVFRVEAGPATM